MPKMRKSSLHRSSRNRRRSNLRLVLLLILVLAVASLLIWTIVSDSKNGPSSSDLPGESEASALLPEESREPSGESSEPALEDNSEPASEPASEPEKSEPESAASAPEESSQYVTGDPNEITWTNFSQPIPEGAEVTDDYFSDAIFIGDSRTQGFILYSGLTGTTAYADRGLSVESVFTKDVIQIGDKKIPIMDALASTPFSKVYLMLGVNELGWPYSNVFQQKYQAVVQRIKEINPDAEIYVQSILPVSKSKSDGDKIYNNPRITEYNQLIQEVAAEEEVYYLNVAEAVADEDGALPEDASTDGVHLNKPYCQKWLAYLKNHTVEGIGQ